MKKSALALLPLLGGLLWAAGRPPATLTAVRAGRVIPVSGPAMDRALILIRDGKIVEILPSGEAPEGATVIDASNQTVIPGLLEAHTALADGGRDADESVTPEIRALDGYDFHRDNRRMLAGGVTSVYVAPGSRRLLSGLGAVVKTAGRSPGSRTVSEVHGFRISIGEEPKNAPPIFKAPLPASPDNPIRPAKSQYPASRMGQFAELRRTAALRETKQPLMISAHSADDLVKALLFAEEVGRPLVLLDAEEAPAVADLLAEKKVPVVFDAGYAPGRRDTSDGARPSLEAAGSLEGAALLEKAGVKFALQAPGDDELPDLLFIAAAAVRAGVSEEQALRAVTLSPAEILGVERRVGSIAKGRDADLVFLDGAPLAPGSRVQRVMVDGEIVFERREADSLTFVPERPAKGKDVLAIRGARLLTVTQGIIPEGLILIENRKISYVGRSRPIPEEAKILEAAGLTAVPGFIDLQSHVGFHLDRSEGALQRGRAHPVPGSLQTPPSRVVRIDDPALKAVAASGVTAVLLAPENAGVCSVLKLSGEGVAVVKEVAALKLAAQGGTAGYLALKEQLQKGKKYHEDWEAYEKARKEPAKPAPAEGAKAAPDPVSGTWKGTLEVAEQGTKAEFTLELKLDGTKVTGTILSQFTGPNPEAIEGGFEAGELKFERSQGGSKVEVSLKPSGPDHLKGTWKLTSAALQLRGTLECHRTASPAAPATAAAPKAEPKEPRRDEALEAFRPLFRKEIPAIVAARDLPAIEAALRALRDDFDLETILIGAEDAPYAGDRIAAKGAGVAVGPDFLQERRGGTLNAAESLASQGLPIAFHSSGLTSTSTLPLTAAYAVRHGLDPFDALRALTVAPARMLKLESRLGALERGRDADLVLFTGEVFSLTSRVRYVLIDGSIVHEAK